MWRALSAQMLNWQHSFWGSGLDLTMGPDADCVSDSGLAGLAPCPTAANPSGAAARSAQIAIVMPPSATSVCPVMKAEASLARKTAAPARSCGVPQRFIGVRLRIHS